MSDTIYALSSGPLPSGVAVLRISGPGCRSAGEALVGVLPRPRAASLRSIRACDTGEVIDRGLVLWFPGPASFTGEDVLELHVHGSRAVLAAVILSLSKLPGLRAAEAGEFTRRAFFNDKMDLTEAEGLADLIEAQTEAQRRQALRQAGGALHRAAATWRSELLDLMAVISATLDFADEGDVDAFPAAEVLARVGVLARSLGAALESARSAEIIREGATVVIAGPPNAGKSSLLNALARRDVALVSPYAGTTRDVIEVTLDLQGLPVVFVDTAGLRETDDPVERMGIERTKARVEHADLILWLSEDETPPPRDMDHSIRVRTKSDLFGSPPVDALPVSAQMGWGLEGLLDLIHAELAALVTSPEPPLVTRDRHRYALDRAKEFLDGATPGMPAELVAEHLRGACIALDVLVGRIDVEDVLGVIFGRFCIGK
jgi:tRNA modification GTPase